MEFKIEEVLPVDDIVVIGVVVEGMDSLDDTMDGIQFVRKVAAVAVAVAVVVS